MIRRDIRLADGSSGWMLISQVEHARLSALLASMCRGRFEDHAAIGSPGADLTAVAARPDEIRLAVLAAILHHDDGWMEWEQAPQLGGDGRPLSFTEVHHTDSVQIWSRSIASAERFGALAAWMVAGHFLRLAGSATEAHGKPELAAWITETEERRLDLFASWQQTDPTRHTPELAGEALEWLWTFDEVSLWLCCSCQGDEPIPCAPQPYLAGRGTPIEMELHAVGAHEAVACPWHFSRDLIQTTVSGQVIRAAKYAESAEIPAAGVPHELVWRLAVDKKLLETTPKPRS